MTSSPSWALQACLEANEDFIIAVVENLQINRVSDAFTHYSMLQANLVTLAKEVDQYPSEQSNPYENLFTFPDEIMRNDVLDELRPREAFKLGNVDVPEPCVKCAESGKDAATCRKELKHMGPSSKLSAKERESYSRAAKYLRERYNALTAKDGLKRARVGEAGLGSRVGQSSGEAAGGAEAEGDPVQKTRTYQRWSPEERHTLLLGIGVYGLDEQKIAGLLNNRTKDTVHSYIAKNVPKEAVQAAQRKEFPPPPEGYVVPEVVKRLLNLRGRGGGQEGCEELCDSGGGGGTGAGTGLSGGSSGMLSSVDMVPYESMGLQSGRSAAGINRKKRFDNLVSMVTGVDPRTMPCSTELGEGEDAVAARAGEDSIPREEAVGVLDEGSYSHSHSHSHSNSHSNSHSHSHSSPRPSISVPVLGGHMALKLLGSERIPFLTVFNSEVGYGMTSALIAGHKHPHLPVVAAISDVRSDAGKAIAGVERLLHSLPLPATPAWDIDGAPYGHPEYRATYKDSADPRERVKTAPDPLRALLVKYRVDQVRKPKAPVYRKGGARQKGTARGEDEMKKKAKLVEASSATVPSAELEGRASSSSSSSSSPPSSLAQGGACEAPPSQALMSLMEDSNVSYMEAGDSVVVQAGTAASLHQGQTAVTASAEDRVVPVLMPIPQENSFMPGEASHLGAPMSTSRLHETGTGAAPTLVTVQGEDDAAEEKKDKDQSGKGGKGSGMKRGPYKRTKEKLALEAKARVLGRALLFGTDEGELMSVLAPPPAPPPLPEDGLAGNGEAQAVSQSDEPGGEGGGARARKGGKKGSKRRRRDSSVEQGGAGAPVSGRSFLQSIGLVGGHSNLPSASSASSTQASESPSASGGGTAGARPSKSKKTKGATGKSKAAKRALASSIGTAGEASLLLGPGSGLSMNPFEGLGGEASIPHLAPEQMSIMLPEGGLSHQGTSILPPSGSSNMDGGGLMLIENFGDEHSFLQAPQPPPAPAPRSSLGSTATHGMTAGSPTRARGQDA